MPNIKEETYKIQYCDCNKDGLLKTSRLCELFEAAAMNALEVGLEGDLRTVMMRYKIVFHSPMRGREDIRIKTYLCKYTKYMSVRRFEIYAGESGELKAEALAVWSMMSMEKQKLVMIPEGVKAFVVPYLKDASIEKPAEPTDGKTVLIQLREDDFDHNRHVNNSKYFSFIDLGLNDNIIGGRLLKEVTVCFEQGIRHGDAVSLLTHCSEENGTLYVSQKISCWETRCALMKSVYA